MEITSEMMESNLKHHKRIEILTQAYHLFVEKGIENVSMIEIAAKSRMQRRNIYNYYEDKDDIVIELMDCWYRQMNSVKVARKEQENALEYIGRMMYGFYDMATQDPDAIIYSVLFDQYYRNNQNNQKLKTYAIRSDQYMNASGLFQQGIEDGSIHKKYRESIGQIEQMMQGVILAFAQRVLFYENVLDHRYGHSREEIKVLIDFFLQELKA